MILKWFTKQVNYYIIAAWFEVFNTMAHALIYSIEIIQRTAAIHGQMHVNYLKFYFSQMLLHVRDSILVDYDVICNYEFDMILRIYMSRTVKLELSRANTPHAL